MKLGFSFATPGPARHPPFLPSPQLCRTRRLVAAASSLSSEMENAGTAIYPLRRCKTLYLVRHAQGIHNVEGEKDFNAYMSSTLFDAHLTSFGWEQVDNLRQHIQKSGIAKKVQLVITSPMLRTMQTAVGAFGGDSCSDGISVPPLMVKNAGNSDRAAISSINCPHFMAVEDCREHLGVHPCDKRRSITEYRTMFPAMDFSLIKSDEDIYWKPDIREPDNDLADRGKKFFDWLWTREEEEIAVVSHSGFLFHSLGKFGNDCIPSVKQEICKHFSNCELRTMVLVDRGAAGSDSKSFDYPGKIPDGPDRPSDLAGPKSSN